VAGWPCPLSDWLAAPPRRPRPLRLATTGAQVINGTRPGATTTTGTGINATTGKVLQAKVLRRAGGPGDPRRRGRRRSPLHHLGRPRPTSCGTPPPTPGDSLTTEYGPRSDQTPAIAVHREADQRALRNGSPAQRDLGLDRPRCFRSVVGGDQLDSRGYRRFAACPGWFRFDV